MVKYIISLLFFSICSITNAQIEFVKVYSDLGFEKGEGITQLSDSSYLVTGSTTSFGEGPPQAFLMKLDSLGERIWTKHYGGIEINEGKRVFAIENYGYYLGGNTNSNIDADHNFYLVKTDENGDPLFEKQIGTDAWDFVHDGLLLSDSSIILTGETYNTPDGQEDIYTIRFDKNGDTLWTSQSHRPGIDKINAAETVGDTAFVLAGTVWNSDSSMLKAFVGCYYYDNSPIWELEFGEINDYVIKGVEVYNNKIYAVGYRINPDDNEKDEYTLQIHAPNGGMISTYAYYGTSDKAGQTVTKYGPGINFYLGFSFEDQFSLGSGDDIFLGKYDDFFSYQGLFVQFLAIDQDEIGQVIATSDGGVILVGTNRSLGTENANVLLIKIGPNDSLPNTTNIPYVNSLVSLEDVVLNPNANIWPNPFINEIKVQFKESVNGTLNVYSALGEKIKTQKINDSFSLIGLTDIDNGTYFLELVTSSNRLVLGKIVKL